MRPDSVKERIAWNHQGFDVLNQRVEGAIDSRITSNSQDTNLDSNGTSRRLQFVCFGRGSRVVRMNNEADRREIRNKLVQYLEPFESEIDGEEADASYIAFGPAQACDKS